MQATRNDVGHVGHYEKGESPEYASMRLMLWLFFLGMAILGVLRYAGNG